MPEEHKNSDEKALRIAYLIAGFVKQTLTPEEHDELDNWVEASDDNMLLFEELTDPLTIEQGLQKLQSENSKSAYQKIRRQLPFTKAPVYQRIWPYTVAASLLLAVSSIWYFKYQSKEPLLPAEAIIADLEPGGNKAQLTLSDGTVYILDGTSNDFIPKQGGSQVLIQENTVWYEAPGELTDEPISYNTLTTPRGGQYKVRLADGTQAWLNAASSLRFPSAFTGAERRVEITGEVYLEVAPNPTHPFIAVVGSQEVRVLGTRFNVNAYEGPVTTLVEGKVALFQGGQQAVLQPGESGYWKGSGFAIQPAHHLDDIIAWTEGKFLFSGVPIETIMGQLSRWYDAEVIYEGARPRARFHAELSRDLPLSKALALLEKTGHVHFLRDGRKIIVRP